ncbi:MAG: hypothetical protein CMJ70_18365 [Planctomycetaceae bacterium]|nr:hypothetical protein [Planctomycetaceae bacterium]MBO10551.1 hypothetical protein [Planctomycetaceae bacterium]
MPPGGTMKILAGYGSLASRARPCLLLTTETGLAGTSGTICSNEISRSGRPVPSQPNRSVTAANRTNKKYVF